MARKVNTTMTETLMLVGGGLVGAGLGLLFAPRSGRRTRAGIARFGKEVGRKGERVVSGVADRMEELSERVGDGARDFRTSIRKGIDSVGRSGWKGMKTSG